MPLPKPSAGESEQDFMDRCMGDSTMNTEYPDDSQRAAVCHSLYGDNRGGDMERAKRYQWGRLEHKQEGDLELYTIVASTPAVDRDNEVILPRAYKASLKGYLKTNPVILYMHDMWKPAVGKAVAGRVEDDALRLEMQWAETAVAQELKYLYDEGFMNTFSVGFIPQKAITDPNEIMRELRKLGWEFDDDQTKLPWRVYTEVELLEVSAVTVPSNREAVMQRAHDALTEEFDDSVLAKFFEGVDQKAAPVSIEGDEEPVTPADSPDGSKSARPYLDFAEAALRAEHRSSK